MRAGLLDRRITIERKSVTRDAMGGELITWVPLVYAPGSPQVAVRFPAEVQDALPSKAESVEQGAAIAINRTRIRIRWRSDVDSTMRIIVHGASDVIYQIVGGPAEIWGRKGGLEMMCEKFSAAGR